MKNQPIKEPLSLIFSNILKIVLDYTIKSKQWNCSKKRPANQHFCVNQQFIQLKRKKGNYYTFHIAFLKLCSKNNPSKRKEIQEVWWKQRLIPAWPPSSWRQNIRKSLLVSNTAKPRSWAWTWHGANPEKSSLILWVIFWQPCRSLRIVLTALLTPGITVNWQVCPSVMRPSVVSLI